MRLGCWPLGPALGLSPSFPLAPARHLGHFPPHFPLQGEGFRAFAPARHLGHFPPHFPLQPEGFTFLAPARHLGHLPPHRPLHFGPGFPDDPCGPRILAAVSRCWGFRMLKIPFLTSPAICCIAARAPPTIFLAFAARCSRFIPLMAWMTRCCMCPTRCPQPCASLPNASLCCGSRRSSLADSSLPNIGPIGLPMAFLMNPSSMAPGVGPREGPPAGRLGANRGFGDAGRRIGPAPRR